MGRDISLAVFTGDDRRRYREKVRRCLDVFARMLAESRFDEGSPLTGVEIELNLTDSTGDPTMRNAQVLEAVADPKFQTELGQFTIEVNVPPRSLVDKGLAAYEREIRESLNAAQQVASGLDTHIMMCGILPTIQEKHVQATSISANPRYSLLNEQIFAARGEDLPIRITGAEQLSAYADTIAPEAACTSTQFHLQVAPADFGQYWNASQAIAGLQLALGANSPFLFGKHLWAETRIALFEQATDTRSEELKAQGVRPRVWFGERWVTSIFDLFEENVRYYPALLPLCDEEDPVEALERGDAPLLGELTLHNGTIYRWNRPVYDIVDGVPHVRVENRVLPSGPTVIDTCANAAFYFGVVRTLAEADRPVWTQMSFDAATANFHAGALHGIDGRMYWPGLGEVSATELVLRRLLPLAHEGLDAWGVEPGVRDRLLGIIEQRCIVNRNGASWLADSVRAAERRGATDRVQVLREVTKRYITFMDENVPIHEWPAG